MPVTCMYATSRKLTDYFNFKCKSEQSTHITSHVSNLALVKCLIRINVLNSQMSRERLAM